MTTDTATNAPHIPVLLHQMLDTMQPADNETYVDGTFGAGGYSRALLNAARCRVVAIDHDPAAARHARNLERNFRDQLVYLHGPFSAMEQLLANNNIARVDGVVLDIGVSSMQIDDAERGFSFRHDGPLDMRMAQTGPSAADVVNTMDETELADIIYTYGEEKQSRAVARAIVKHRSENDITRTAQLADIVRRVVRSNHKTDAATRTFQALRIYVNDELGELQRGLRAAERILLPGGRLVVVTFHSLEDRIVKLFFQDRSQKVEKMISRHLPPANSNMPRPTFELLTKKPLVADDAENDANPRARSAKLRAAIRTSEPSVNESEAI